MGVKVFKNQEGKVMVQGIPAGCWVFVVFGVLFYVIGWPVLLAGSVLSGSIIITMGTIFLFCIKPYGNSRRQKKVNEYYKKEDQLKAAEQQSEEQREFEEFKKWKNSQEENIQKKEGLEEYKPVDTKSKSESESESESNKFKQGWT